VEEKAMLWHSQPFQPEMQWTPWRCSIEIVQKFRQNKIHNSCHNMIS